MSTIFGGYGVGELVASHVEPLNEGAGLQQTLQGLLSGNANQDQAVREAYERGYQRGREDEARLRRDRSGTSERSRSYDRAAPRAGAYGGDQDAYPDERQPSGGGR